MLGPAPEPRQTRVGRRGFLARTGAAIASLALGPLGCARRLEGARPAGTPGDLFPFLEVSGTPREIGRAIGKRFGPNIREGLRRRSRWFEELRRFVEQDPASRYDPFLRAAREHLPRVVEEIEGWAEGSGVDLRDLMTLNLYPEISALMARREASCQDCSTLALAHGERLLLAHNEDGDFTYLDLMFLVRASSPGKPGWTCLTYPSVVSGNGPAANDAGLVMTNNFISGLEVRPGIPRYLLSRAILDTRSLAEAVAVATHPARAYSTHFNLGSRTEKKLLSVETSASRQQILEVDGLYLHTNHLVLPGMQDEPQEPSYVKSSSISRYQVLSGDISRLAGLEDVTGDTLVELLSSHERAPYSPCRHPAGEITGATLACALFDLRAGWWRLYAGNPCANRSMAVPLERL